MMIDAHSKWIEVEDMKEATAGATIQRLRAMFARFGIPESLVSDNGPCFISKEFKDFLRKNGVHPLRITRPRMAWQRGL